MYSVQLKSTLFSLWSSCPEIVEIPQFTLNAHQTPVFSS
jgi:hypothetical protein